MQIIRKQQLTTTAWSGGTTTQLAIWPQGASYADRDFTWRVSTARVEAAESEFTSLPGVSRILMVLDGCLHLYHEGHGEAVLERFGQDSFRGDWATRSRGRVTDFNLMMRGCEGRVDALHMPPGGNIDAPHPGADRVLYFLDDGVTVGGVQFFRGDVAVLDGSEGVSVSNHAAAEATVIVATVFRPR